MDPFRAAISAAPRPPRPTGGHAVWILAAVLMTACAGEPASGDGTGPAPPGSGADGPDRPDRPERPERGQDDDTVRYDGPPVRTTWNVLESEPVQHRLAVTVETPTGGWQLELDEVVELGGGVCAVRLRLVEPSPDVLTPQVITPLRVDAALPGDPTRARVEIGRWVDGETYVQPPPYELAAVHENR